MMKWVGKYGAERQVTQNTEYKEKKRAEILGNLRVGWRKSQGKKQGGEIRKVSRE
jgi:hypothetical protein